MELRIQWFGSLAEASTGNPYQGTRMYSFGSGKLMNLYLNNSRQWPELTSGFVLKCLNVIWSLDPILFPARWVVFSSNEIPRKGRWLPSLFELPQCLLKFTFRYICLSLWMAAAGVTVLHPCFCFASFSWLSHLYPFLCWLTLQSQKAS